MLRQCARCEIVAPLKGPEKYCPPCRRTVTLERKREFEARKRAAAVAARGPKLCVKCSQPAKTERSAYCLPCGRAEEQRIKRDFGRRYEASGARKRDPEAERERNATWRARNPDRRGASVRKYNEANRDEINRKARERNRTAKRRAYMVEWERRMAATNPSFVLNGRMKQALRASLRGEKRGRRWEALVGYTLEELRAHLERQFVKGMGWHNMADWHIDHIVPKAAFKFANADDPAFRACWTLTNLRPLWSAENLSKNAKRLHLI